MTSWLPDMCSDLYDGHLLEMTHAVGPVSAHLDEAAEEQPALAHSGRLHKVELRKLKVLSMDFLCGWVWNCTLRLRSRKHGRNLQ